jgi:choice-of-anchor B domain-containing protein
MTIRLSLFIGLLIASQTLLGQRDNFNLDLLMQKDYPEDCNDIWGYVDENGNEYAILGTVEATAVLALDGPDAPREIAYIPGTRSTWRDMKHFGDRVYVTTDVGEDGLLIIDMSEISSDSVDFFYWTPQLSLNGNDLGVLDKCHNLYVDDTSGYLYLSGCNNLNSGGMLIFDLNENPDEPNLIGASRSVYSHDVYVNDSLMFGNDIYNGELSIFDVTDKSSPELVALQPTTGAFTHNAWSSSNNDFVFTTDEISGGFVDAYDIRSFDNIQRLDSWRPANALDSGIIPHNTHYHNGFLHTSWYIEGIIVLDARDPSNLVPAAWYDTYDGNQRRFNGAWGAYPFLPSGRLLVSDINSGLFVFDTHIQPAARLEGNVTDIITEEPLQDVEITIEDFINTREVTAADGSYKTGTAQFDSVIIHFEKPNYLSFTDTLTLFAGETLTLDVELVPDFALFTWDLNLRDSAENFALDHAQIRLFSIGEEENFTYETQSNGQLTQPLIPEGSFELYYGKWGWKENWNPNFTINSARADSLFLARGYRDYFNLDLGWTTEATSSVGQWERAIPAGTEIDSLISNPNQSSPNDFGAHAFVTGNDDRNVGFDDVDDGDVSLFSPWMDLSDWTNVTVSFDYWFFNAGGAAEPDDSLSITLRTPDEHFHVQTITTSKSEWIPFSFHFDSLQAMRSDSVQLSFVASDYTEGSGHIVEAGIDAFEVNGDRLTTSISYPIHSLSAFPNPTSDFLYLRSLDTDFDAADPIIAMVYHSSGQLAEYGKLTGNKLNVSHLTAGTYVIVLKQNKKVWRTKFQVIH